MGCNCKKTNNNPQPKIETPYPVIEVKITERPTTEEEQKLIDEFDKSEDNG